MSDRSPIIQRAIRRLRAADPRRASRASLALATLLACSTLPSAPAAAAVPAAAVRLYQNGLALKHSDPAAALKDFRQASALAPTWEPPVYEEGALLAVRNFPAAVPVLLHAARLAPQDDTVWNVLGWGYYQQKNFTSAETSFDRQLHIVPDSAAGLWGLANCYANSAVRAFARARTTLMKLLPLASGTLKADAGAMLAALPPDAVDPTYDPSTPVTIQDAIAMTLSWRNVPAAAPGAAALTGKWAQDGHDASADVANYVAWTAVHGDLAGLAIPSFRAPATRLFVALLLAHLYGVNAYDYIRPFALTDMNGVPVDERMTVDSMLAMRLMTETGTGLFSPDETLSRTAMGALVAHVNTVMAQPPGPSAWLTPPAPAPNPHPWIYMFATGQPGPVADTADIVANAADLTALGLTYYPFIQDSLPSPAQVRERTDRTQYILTAMSAGPAVVAELQTAQKTGVKPFLVLANYNENTDRSDPAVVTAALATDASRQGLAREAAAIAMQEGLAGVTVDFENVAPQDRDRLTAFLADLHASLLADHLLTMVCLPERESDTTGSPAYDYTALGANADLVMLITYDEHVPGGQPGPIAVYSNVTRVVQYALAQIPADKILLGVADYGYDWPAGGTGSEVSMAQAEELAASHGVKATMDTVSQSPTFSYTANGVKHTVWFEDDQSIANLAALVQTYGLKGVAVWHLGAEDAGFWKAVEG